MSLTLVVPLLAFVGFLIGIAGQSAPSILVPFQFTAYVLRNVLGVSLVATILAVAALPGLWIFELCRTFHIRRLRALSIAVAWCSLYLGAAVVLTRPSVPPFRNYQHPRLRTPAKHVHINAADFQILDGPTNSTPTRVRRAGEFYLPPQRSNR